MATLTDSPVTTAAPASVSRRTAMAYFAAGCTAPGRRVLAGIPEAVKSYAEFDGITEQEERETLLAVADAIDAVTAEGLSRAAAWYEAGLDQFHGPFPGEDAEAAMSCGTCGHPEDQHDEFGECQAPDAATGEPCWGICGEGAGRS